MSRYGSAVHLLAGALEDLRLTLPEAEVSLVASPNGTTAVVATRAVDGLVETVRWEASTIEVTRTHDPETVVALVVGRLLREAGARGWRVR